VPWWGLAKSQFGQMLMGYTVQTPEKVCSWFIYTCFFFPVQGSTSTAVLSSGDHSDCGEWPHITLRGHQWWDWIVMLKDSFPFSSAVSEAVILRTLSYQEAWEMVKFTTLLVPVNAELSNCMFLSLYLCGFAVLFWGKCLTSSHYYACDAIWYPHFDKECF